MTVLTLKVNISVRNNNFTGFVAILFRADAYLISSFNEQPGKLEPILLVKCVVFLRFYLQKV